jgi:L-ectoine synthase
VIVRRLSDIEDTDRDIDTPNWRSRRLLLADDGVGFSLHDTIIRAGTTTEMWYQNHYEAVYCVGGRGELLDRETGERHVLEPGTVYLLDQHDQHTVHEVTEDLHLVCVFNPPITGREVHDESGAYPLVTPTETA